MQRSKLGSREMPQNHHLVSMVISIVTCILLLAQPGLAGAQTDLPILPGAEPTADGLYPLDPSIMGTAWVRPDADLSRYTRLFAMPTAVQFRDVPDRWHNARTIEGATAFYIDERRKEQLREIFRESFNEALSEARSFDLTNELGRDVILVQGILTDVISGVPPYISGSTITNIRWAWETNIVLEIRDAMSDTVLARTVERKRMDGPIDATMVGVLTPIMVNGWSRLLVRRLEELRNLSPSRLSRLEERAQE
ncbi:MAG: DUF3313 domain-containing protein [Gammaproteobacteria bacterium]|nr:DUF3313 domain-containing protein [Gammaproteobacteria bacterium]